jgi:hypothetical protein
LDILYFSLYGLNAIGILGHGVVGAHMCGSDYLTEDMFVSETHSLVPISSTSKYILVSDVITSEFAVLLYVLLAFKAVVGAPY